VATLQIQRARGRFPGIRAFYQVSAVWRGGPYIDLFWGYDPAYGQPGDDRAPFDVINVYDYRAGRVSEHMTRWGAVTRELEEWYESLGESPDDRAAELTNYFNHTA
jgi:hypothetical protein